MLLAALAMVVADPMPVSPVSHRLKVEAASWNNVTLHEDDLLLYSAQLDSLTLTETLTAYGDPRDPLLPLGELARLLELDISVSPAMGRVSGFIGQERRALTLDFPTGVATVGGKQLLLTRADQGSTPADIYVRASSLQFILPIRFEVDAEALSIRLKALQKLPIQFRMERVARLRGLSQSGEIEAEPSLFLASPYQSYSAPSFDAAFEVGRDSRTQQPFSRRYDIRAAGDILYTNFQAYIGSDERGRASDARVLFERKSAEGALPLGATRISAGDVFTPSLGIGPRSGAGRGVSFSTAPLEQASVFDTIDLRGELPIGFDVELYVNDVLRGGQRSPVQGRYEFLDVPLARGMNVIRIVSHGPLGDRSETVRVINVGGGALKAGETHLDFGMVQQGQDLVQFGDRRLIEDLSGWRMVASAAHGMSNEITLVGGLSRYGVRGRTSRLVGVAGMRGSLAGLAVQLDAAADAKGGRALAFGFAGQPLGVSTIFQHAEYRGGFIDENLQVLDLGRVSARYTSVAFDLSMPLSSDKALPLSMRVTRTAHADGGTTWVAGARTTTTIASSLVSGGLDYLRDWNLNALQKRLTGNVSVAKHLNFDWQFRGSADFELLPVARARAVSLTSDKSLSDRVALRLGSGRSMGRNKETFAQAGSVVRLPFGELALTSDFNVRSKDWRISVRFGFGSLFDRTRQRYVVTPPGAAAGGNAVLHAFIDRNSDGRFGDDDSPVKNVRIEGGVGVRQTDGTGRLVMTGLGSGPRAIVKTNIENIEQFDVGGPPSRVEFRPRPGQVLQIPYPLVPVGEVYLRIVTERSGRLTGLSAVKVVLKRSRGNALESTTEFDGSVVFSELPVGRYTLELDREQAARLGMTLNGPVTFVVSGSTGPEIEARVHFAGSKHSDLERTIAESAVTEPLSE